LCGATVLGEQCHYAAKCVGTVDIGVARELKYFPFYKDNTGSALCL